MGLLLRRIQLSWKTRNCSRNLCYQYPYTCQKLSKSDNSLKGYDQIKYATSETADLHTRFYKPKTFFKLTFFICLKLFLHILFGK